LAGPEPPIIHRDLAGQAGLHHWLGHELKPGANLRGADLRWANLARCDLARADLSGADCTGATFSGAILTGAKFKGTRLFQANLGGALGMDLTGAELHPFFQVAPGEQIGALRFFDPEVAGDGALRGQPRCLVCSPNGTLLWVEGPGSPLQLATPTGARFALDGQVDRHIYGIQKDSENHLWLFGNHSFGYLDLTEIGAKPTHKFGRYTAGPSVFTEVPNALAAGIAGDVCVSLPHRVLRFYRKGTLMLFDEGEAMEASPRSASQVAVPDRDGVIHIVGPDRDSLLIEPLKGRRSLGIKLAEGNRIRRIARGGDQRLWFTQSGLEAIGCFYLARMNMQVLPLQRLTAEAREPFDLALGPDGNMWFTEQSGRISRLTPEGELTSFELPEGYRPMEIIAGTDGRMLFTLEGRNLIGAIRAVAPLVPGKAAGLERKDRAPSLGGEAFAEWAGVIHKARPQRRKALTDRERRERQVAAEARFQALQALEPEDPPAASGGRSRTVAGMGEVHPLATGSEAKKDSSAIMEMPAPGPGLVETRPATACERLAALNVNLAPGALRHILAGHGQDRMNHKSQFHSRFSTAHGLEELFAHGLEEAGELARERCCNSYGRFLTRCRMPKVGWSNSHGQFTETDWFQVVLAKVGSGKDSQYDILSAYPVP
jgi:hypothetical protein